jgi:hypothetical protein
MAFPLCYPEDGLRGKLLARTSAGTAPAGSTTTIVLTILRRGIVEALKKLNRNARE